MPPLRSGRAGTANRAGFVGTTGYGPVVRAHQGVQEVSGGRARACQILLALCLAPVVAAPPCFRVRRARERGGVTPGGRLLAEEKPAAVGGGVGGVPC